MTTEKCVVNTALKNTSGLEEMSPGAAYSPVPSHPTNLVNVWIFPSHRPNLCFVKIDFILVVTWAFKIIEKYFSGTDIRHISENQYNLKVDEYLLILLKMFLDSVYIFKDWNHWFWLKPMHLGRAKKKK